MKHANNKTESAVFEARVRCGDVAVIVLGCWPKGCGFDPFRGGRISYGGENTGGPVYRVFPADVDQPRVVEIPVPLVPLYDVPHNHIVVVARKTTAIIKS